MKWPFTKKTTQKPALKPPRIRASGVHRITGMVTGCPTWLKFLVEGIFSILLLIGLFVGCKALFLLYFKTNPQFRLVGMYDNVKVTTGKMVTPEIVYQTFGLSEGTNLFQVNIDERRNLLINTPNIRDASVSRELPDKLSITIIEREPVARVKPIGWVVDEDGVVFIRYAGTGNLPLIHLSDEFAQAKPGDRLGGMDMAAVRLVCNAMRPGCKLRIMELDAKHQDYLRLSFSDYREAKFAWKGMLEPSEANNALMQQQLDDLGAAMESAIGQPRKMWDATQQGRISAMPLAGEG
ncbi:MAG: FtsQ-type POTRA domain-containing protein [Kiritimatiellae bacterium]|nr:FtsQ-type POTRA domain-containing protein [Kiritimatiellia bacterium]